MAIAILPMLRVGGMQLFRTESSDRSEKAMPRVAQVAGHTAAIYFGLVGAVGGPLLGGRNERCSRVSAHAMTTIATGGFSTSDSLASVISTAP